MDISAPNLSVATTSDLADDPMTRDEYEAFKNAVNEIDEVKSGLVEIKLFGAGHRENEIELAQLWSHVERGKGHATRAMHAFLKLADECEVNIVLTPFALFYDVGLGDYSDDEADRLEALNEKVMNNYQLIEWYDRFGFEETGYKDGDAPVMKRNWRAPIATPIP